MDEWSEPEAWRKATSVSEDDKLNNLHTLEELDRALRCGICGELLDSPVAPPCMHAFCSVCIRRSLAAFNEVCPNCRAPASSEALKPQHALAAASDAFRSARPALVSLCHSRLQQQHSDDANTHAHDGADTDGYSTSVIELDDGSQATRNGDTNRHQQNTGAPYRGRLDGKESCPICGMLVPTSVLNSHAEACLMKQESKRTQTPAAEHKGSTTAHSNAHSQQQRVEDAALPASTPRASESVTDTEQLPARMGKLHYGLLSEKQMKQKAAECQLPTNHGKDTLAWMHAEFTHRYNAAIDGHKKPKTAAIAREVVRLARETDKRVCAPNASASTMMHNKTQARSDSSSVFTSLVESVKQRDGLQPSMHATKRQRTSEEGGHAESTYKETFHSPA